jgi:hypothetical protein
MIVNTIECTFIVQGRWKKEASPSLLIGLLKAACARPISGRDLSPIGERLGMQISAVRTHLRSLFEKSSTNRQDGSIVPVTLPRTVHFLLVPTAAAGRYPTREETMHRKYTTLRLRQGQVSVAKLATLTGHPSSPGSLTQQTKQRSAHAT